MAIKTIATLWHKKLLLPRWTVALGQCATIDTIAVPSTMLQPRDPVRVLRPIRYDLNAKFLDTKKFYRI